MKYRYRRTDAFDLWIEPLWFGDILHCDVVRWGASAKKSLRKEILDLASGDRAVWACHPRGENPKLAKFIQLMGGTFSHNATDANGKWFTFYRFLPLD